MDRTSSARGYDQLACVYDELYGDFVLQYEPILDCLLAPRLPKGAAILDACCGTGLLAHRLIQRGFRVTGLDTSEGMLTRAIGRNPTSSFLNCDIRHFHSHSQFDAVVSTYDSINHLPDLIDVQACFSNVYQSLKSGGWFFFDLNMERGLFARWCREYDVSLSDFQVNVRLSYDTEQRIGLHRARITRLTGEPLVSVSELLERCYDGDLILSTLTSVGFRQLLVLEESEVNFRDVGRSLFIAQRGFSPSRGA